MENIYFSFQADNSPPLLFKEKKSCKQYKLYCSFLPLHNINWNLTLVLLSLFDFQFCYRYIWMHTPDIYMICIFYPHLCATHLHFHIEFKDRKKMLLCMYNYLNRKTLQLLLEENFSMSANRINYNIIWKLNRCIESLIKR